MNEPLFAMDPESVVADVGEGVVHLRVDTGIYPLEAVYAAAYVFIARCWVLLDKPEPNRIRVTLTAKNAGVSADDLRALVGEFGNELLSCAWRHEITKTNRAMIEAVTMQAFGGAMGPPSLDELAAFDFTDEPFDDPLGIAQSWEEKYKKKPAKEPEDGG
jgi:His-Xaa-Ser system protein HxsD